MKITRRSKMKCKRETDVSCIRDSPRRSHHAIALPDSDRGALQTPCLDSRHLLICSTLVREKGRESYESRTRMNTDYGMACTHQSVNTEKTKNTKTCHRFGEASAETRSETEKQRIHQPGGK